MVEVEKLHRLRFAEFSADLVSGELFRHRTRVSLQDKPFQVLALLLRRPRQLVSRLEIIHTVWPDTFVEGDLCLNVAVRRLRLALADDPENPRFIETVGSHGYRFICSVHAPPAHEEAELDHTRPRVAVFPLKTMLAPEPGMFAGALTETLTTQLRQMNPPFAVITPEFTEERAHKGRGTLALCRQIAADYVLVGAVALTEGRVQVSVRLLDCQAQTCIWARSYAHDEGDRLATLEDLSRNIASAMIEVVPSKICQSRLSLIPSSAQEKYFQGCYFLSRLTEATVDRCIPLLEEAVREHPNFALAWAALANANCVIARLGLLPSQKVFPRVKSAADRAIHIEDLAQARTARAYYHFLYERDWGATEADLVRSLAIDPHYPIALGGYAQLLVVLGRGEDAVAMMQRACDSDPLSAYTTMMMGWTFCYTRRYDEALVHLDRALLLDPSMWFAQITKATALEEMGKVDEALVSLNHAVDLSGHSALARANLACGLARSGNRKASKEILGELLRLRERHYFSPYWIAAIYASLNQHREAVEWLTTAGKELCAWLVFLATDPIFSGLQSEPHLQSLVLSHP